MVLSEGGVSRYGIRRNTIGYRSAKQIYAGQLQAALESLHKDRFVAIEPDSGEYFLGDTFEEAVKAARMKYPSRLSHTIRIGHRAAFRGSEGRKNVKGNR